MDRPAGRRRSPGPGPIDPPPDRRDGPCRSRRPGSRRPRRVRGWPSRWSSPRGRRPGPSSRSRPGSRRVDGLGVLAQLKADPHLRAIPVVVLTTSGRDEDVARAYQAGANTYIQKPAEYPRYRELVLSLKTYWLETALRPPRRGHRP
ncbi:MAG TPA: response regulator [Isosphaeraceae bacterium]